MEKEIRIVSKVKNNLLLIAIERKGYKVGANFCDLAGIRYQYLNDLINMKTTPLDRHGNYKKCIFKLCEFLNKMPDELFSDWQKNNKLENNCIVQEVLLDEYLLNANADPVKSIENLELTDAIYNILDTLTEKEGYIIKKRFGMESNENTLSDLSEEFNVSENRIRQIEQKALRKLRHPTRCDRLIPYTYNA